MQGVEFLSGVLFPFLNFFMFLAVLIYFIRQPLQRFAHHQHANFLHSASTASAKAEELATLEEEVRQARSSIAKDLPALEAQMITDAEQEAALLAAEGGKVAAQIRNEVQQVTTAFRTELRAELKRVILQRVQQQLQERLPQHTARSDARAVCSLQAGGPCDECRRALCPCPIRTCRRCRGTARKVSRRQRSLHHPASTGLLATSGCCLACPSRPRRRGRRPR